MIYRIYSKEENCTVATVNGKLAEARKKAFYLILKGEWDNLLIQIVKKNGECRTVGFMCNCDREIGYISLYKKKGVGHAYYVSLLGNLKHRFDGEADRHISWEMVSDRDCAYMFGNYRANQ